MSKIKGISASIGIVIGKAFFIGTEDLDVPRHKIAYEDLSREIYRLEEALIETRKEIAKLQKRIAENMGSEHGKIFEAHMLVLEDRILIEDIINLIKDKKVNVEYAFSQSIRKYSDTLKKLDDDYLRERATDIEDVAKRVLHKLLKKETMTLEQLKEKVIIVAHDLSPSETAVLPKNKILGFVTDIGGRTSHTAIIARNLGMPAVVGTEIITQKIKQGDTLIIDGKEGLVYVNPTEKQLEGYKKKKAVIKKGTRAIHIPKYLKAHTKDGKRVVISANIELPEELPLVDVFRAEGIGLYRTEYMFLGRRDLPTEEEQFNAYANVIKKANPHQVIVRTIDIGGDKFLSKPEVPREMTPFLGWRAIRFCLANPQIFKAQLRAILRASVEGEVRIMFPMISGVEELRQAKAILDECKRELKKSHKKFKDDLEVGVMIEVPSAALTADVLAKECDFFSIGTNDLIQYSLAVDRADEKVAYLYEPAHPAVMKLIRNVIACAHNNNIWSGMCGEMAGESLFTVLLLGMGLDEFSMPPPRIPRVKELISKLNVSDAEKMVDKCLSFSTARELEKFLQDSVKHLLKDDYQKYISV